LDEDDSSDEEEISDEEDAGTLLEEDFAELDETELEDDFATLELQVALDPSLRQRT
jgi:hypothetical protein